MSIALGAQSIARRTSEKFQNSDWTATGEPRASVMLTALKTLWFNTGTLCNIACKNCYIESSPKNDNLVYITGAEVEAYLEEIRALNLPTNEIAFTGGEPFLNPEMIQMTEVSLVHGHSVLVLTNAMRPMMRPRIKTELLRLLNTYGDALKLRVSIDHHNEAIHDEERGTGSFRSSLDGIRWLVESGFDISIAGRTFDREPEAEMRQGFADMFRDAHIALDAMNPAQLMLFPEMDLAAEVPEITTACWDILGKAPEDIMYATSRMIVKRKGDALPKIVACTLLPYEPEFEYGTTLAEAIAHKGGNVKLNHPHCAKFCVLGGGSCTN